MKTERIKYKAYLLIKRLKLRNLPILSKLLLIFGMIFALMVLLSIVNFNNYSKDKEVSTMNMVSQSDNQTMTKIDEYLNDLITLTKYPLTRQTEVEEDKNIKIINYLTELTDFNNTDRYSYNFDRLTNKMADEMVSLRNQIDSVFIFNSNGQYDYKMNNTLSEQFDVKKTKWFKKTIDDFGKPNIVSTFEMPKLSYNSNQKIYVFSVSRGILSVESGKVIGVILINTKTDYFDKLFRKTLMPGQRIVIADSDNNIIYDTTLSNIAKKLDNNLVGISKHEANTTNSINLNGEAMLISYTSSSLSGWKMINLIPKKEINKEIIKIKNYTVVITISIILISIGLAFIISRQIVNPIRKLILLMNLIKKGDFDVKIKLENKDEIGILARSFNTMTKKVKRLINEVYIDKVKQKDLEMQMLQNQINPHFLYNTLESISMMALINGDEQASEMATSLGKILRYGISKNKKVVSVREELDHLNDYILLQKARFQKMFDIAVNVDASILDYYIVKLILQPIVENSINHGLSDRRNGGMIEVNGYKKDEHLVLEVTDNGKGMDSEELRKLNEYINDLNNHFKSIGLKNVNRRIKLNYGNEYGIVITSIQGQGTSVKITLPCNLEADLS